MNRTFIISILLCLVSSCRQAEEKLSQEELAEAAKRDSLCLHVAVFPTLETLPLYYAERTGVLQENDIRLAHYESMMDCDTSITRGHVEVSFTDEARIISLRHENGVSLTPIASTGSRLGLFSNKEKKTTRIEQLKEKLIGLERHSQSDYWSDKILEGTDLTTLDLFRIQIGSTPLRYSMLMNNLLDVAFLPEPYASLCDSTIVSCLWNQDADDASWTVIAIPETVRKDELRQSQTKQLLDIYEKTREKICSHPDTALLHTIYREDFQITERDLKRTHWFEWKPQPLDSISSKARQEAEDWIYNQRERYKTAGDL